MTSAFLPARRDPGDGSGPAPTWQWYAARIGIGLILASLFGLLWFLHRQELEDGRTALIRDVLWVEQNFQFGLERNVEHLRQLAHDPPLGGPLDAARVSARVDQLLPNSPGIVEVLLLDTSGALRASGPGPSAASPRKSWVPPHLDAAYRLARSTGRATYGAPHPVGREQHLEVFVPYYRDGALAGIVVGVYDLRELLSDLVPWWLAEKHRITIRDGRGGILAARSNVEAADHAILTHQVLLDPPGHGLVLHVTSYGSQTTLVRNGLALTIVFLAVAVLWSLWALRRHIRRRLETEQQLRREYAFRKAMEDSLETGMRAVDLEGRMVYVNPAFCRMVGYSEAELIGHGSPQPYWPPDDVARIEGAMRTSREGGTRRAGVEYEFIRSCGTRFDALLYEAPLVDARAGRPGWMGSLLDITERKRARERARQQEEKLAATARLVTVGEMASTIAHELNQPLSAIASYTTGCLNLLATGAAGEGEIESALQKTAQQAQRAGRIIRRVHQFVRKSEPSRNRVQLNAVIDEAVGFVQAEARDRRVRIRSGPPGRRRARRRPGAAAAGAAQPAAQRHGGDGGDAAGGAGAPRDDRGSATRR